MERSRSGRPERRLDHLSRPHRGVQTSERSLTGSTRSTVIAKPATAAGPRIASMGGPGVPRACASRVRRADPRAWHRSDGSARPPASFSRYPETTRSPQPLAGPAPACPIASAPTGKFRRSADRRSPSPARRARAGVRTSSGSNRRAQRPHPGFADRSEANSSPEATMPRLRRRARDPSHLTDEPRASLRRVNAPPAPAAPQTRVFDDKPAEPSSTDWRQDAKDPASADRGGAVEDVRRLSACDQPLATSRRTGAANETVAFTGIGSDTVSTG